jgi:hypothetical protein
MADFFPPDKSKKRINYAGMQCGCGCSNILVVGSIVNCYSCECKPHFPDHNFKILNGCRSKNRNCLPCQGEIVAVASVQDKVVIEISKKKTRLSTKASTTVKKIKVSPKEVPVGRKPSKLEVAKVSVKELAKALELENEVLAFENENVENEKVVVEGFNVEDVELTDDDLKLRQVICDTFDSCHRLPLNSKQSSSLLRLSLKNLRRTCENELDLSKDSLKERPMFFDLAQQYLTQNKVDFDLEAFFYEVEVETKKVNDVNEELIRKEDDVINERELENSEDEDVGIEGQEDENEELIRKEDDVIIERELENSEDEDVGIEGQEEKEEENAEEAKDPKANKDEFIEEKRTDALENYTYKEMLNGRFPSQRKDRLVAFNIICCVANLFIFNYLSYYFFDCIIF